MKLVTSLGAGAALWLCAALTNASAQDLNVLCGVDEDWCATMEAAFETETGLRVAMERRSTGEILDQIRDEQDEPHVDVWWGGTGDTHLQGAAEGLLEAYQPAHSEDALPWAHNFFQMSGGKASGVYAGALGFAYNSEILEDRDVPTPSCWKDLTGPRYRGLVLMANPKTSGTAFTVLATLIQLLGEDEAFAYLAALAKNIPQFTTSGAAPVKAAARGEAGIGISFIHDAVTQKLAGAPLVIVAPCEGTGYEIGAVSIVKGARNMGNARRFVDFAMSPEGQATGAQSGQNQIPSNARAALPPAAPDISLIRMVDYDFATFGSPEQRRRLLDRFDKEVLEGASSVETQ
ncbi:ABC transporter substrate-binding protein [Roseibium sediminicola]|uniref:ABC transporter substrate-binding protein n=1 Tax=Roseibium sediminicola TaxID=2933272 RepID=A0ABT0H034_9HYPH|nr:ABC transporter substrate-binding protein [Roseibium sp. CAU 1639]MCK7615054.1 ABC transporter substrate-binding protein [Roseibium sp. CAU 1639]